MGPSTRIAMADLRDALGEFGDVRTYLQSGNVVLTSRRAPERVRQDCERLIETHFGFHVDVVVRTKDELADVVRRDPLADVVSDPKRYQVSFLEREPDAEVLDQLAQLAVEPERYEVVGRELYAWHPDGIRRSRFWTKLATGGLGIVATARNWNTVTNLLALASKPA